MNMKFVQKILTREISKQDISWNHCCINIKIRIKFFWNCWQNKIFFTESIFYDHCFNFWHVCFVFVASAYRFTRWMYKNPLKWFHLNLLPFLEFVCWLLICFLFSPLLFADKMRPTLMKRMMWSCALWLIAILLVQNTVGQSNYASHANNVNYLGEGLPGEATLDGKVSK